MRAPGEIAPLQLSFSAIAKTDDSWLMIVEARAASSNSAANTDNGEMRDVELAMDGVAMRLQARNWRAFSMMPPLAKR